MAGLTRREALTGLAAGFATRGWAEAPVTSLRPKPRGLAILANARPSDEAFVAEAKLGGQISYLLADLKTGAVLAAREPDWPMPPASTVKAITALYALEQLVRAKLCDPVVGDRAG